MQGKHIRSQKRDRAGRIVPYCVLIVFLTATLTGGFSYYTGAGIGASVRNTVYLTCPALVLAFLFAASFTRHVLCFDNERHPARFLAAYTVSLLFACAMYFLPYPAWPYAVVFVLLYLTSNEVTGALSGAVLLSLSVLLAGNTARAALLLYLTVGVCAVGMFYAYDRDTRLRTALITVTAVQTACTAAGYLLFLHTEISLNIIAIPLINLAVTLILLFLLARLFLVRVLRRDADRYLDINDPAFSLLQAVRSKNQDEYFRAIHTAYLTERVASALGLHAGAAKTCALYHRIGCLDERESEWSGVEHYFTEFEFPPEALKLLREYIGRGQRAPESREAACVLMCETLVASLLYVFKKDPDAKVDYDEMIERLFAHKTQEGAFSASQASMRELQEMKELLKKEKLYYDFLR